MQGIPIIRLKQFKRTALILGAGTLIAGASALGATQAHAAAGGVTLSPASGSTTGTVTYSSQACPAGNTGSGLLKIIDPGTGATSNLAPVNNSVAAAFTGTLLTNALNIEATSVFPDLAGTPATIEILCYTGASATGTSVVAQTNTITISTDASSYVTGAVTGPVTTTTTLTASPTTAQVGQTVTLTATVAPASGTAAPAGTVQFEVGGTAIGSPVATTASGSNGVATTTTTFAAAGTEALSAVFTPTSTTAFSASTGTFSETVTVTNPNSGTIPLAVTVPATGTFTLTVDTTDTVTLAVSGSTATAATTPITVSDTRNTYPGWSVSGLGNDFAGSGTAAGATLPCAGNLTWTPTNTGTLPQGVTLGSATTSVCPTAAVLASVHAGTGNGAGTTTLGANLFLNIPSGQVAGPYAGGLGITATTTNP